MEKRLIFLQKFTEELIINSTPEELKSLPTVKEEIIQPIEKPKIHLITPPPKTQRPIQMQAPRRQPIQQSPQQPTGGWGKITPLINDQNIISIESPGPGKLITIRNRTRAMPTNILLTDEDIEEIVNKFSQESRIPRIGGVFKAIVNNLVITAIDTDVAGSRFIITKMHSRRSAYL